MRQHRQTNKHQKENRFLKSFLKLETTLDIVRYEKTESPDFILITGKQEKIGLEITTLIIEEKMEEIKKAQLKALRIAQKIAEKKLAPVSVDVWFTDFRKEINIEKTARELLRAVKEFMKKTELSKRWFKYNPDIDGIGWILIRPGTNENDEWLHSHRWTHMSAAWVFSNPEADLRLLSNPEDKPAGDGPIRIIQKSIEKKDEKYDEYKKKCDICFLLTGVDEWSGPESVKLSDAAEKFSFKTKFERVYFLRNITRELTLLKTEPY